MNRKNLLLITLLFLTLGAGCLTKTSQNTTTVAPKPVAAEVNPGQLVPLVEDYLNTVVTKPQMNGKVFSAFIPYGQEIKNKQLYYYIWAQRDEYALNKKVLEIKSGESGPLAIIVEERNGKYDKIVSHKTPDNGSGYAASLAKIFPKNILSKINLKGTELTKRNNLLQKEVKSKAANYFNFKLIDSVEKTQEEKCTVYSFEKYKIAPSQIQTVGMAVWDTPYNTSTYPNYDLRAKIATGYFSGEINFGGHFTVISWECGKKCQEHAVVDGKTGRIIKTGLRTEYGTEFKLNSMVLVLNPYNAILAPDPQELVTSYYVIDESQNIPELKLVCEYDHSVQPVPRSGVDVEPEI